MDWPVIGALAGVTVLAGVVGIGAYAALTSAGPTTAKEPAPPILLSVTPSRPTANVQPGPVPRLQPPPSLSRLVVEDAGDDTAITSSLGIKPVPRLRPESLHAGRPVDPHPKLLAVPRPDGDSFNGRVPSIVAKPPPTKPREQPAADPYDGRVMTARTIRRLRAALRLLPEQLSHWRPVEAILHEIGRAQVAQIKAGRKPEVGTGPMMRLYYAAQPLLGTLRPDQKERIRSLARSLGYGHVASML
jgi:hypothetical protein